MSQHDTPGSQRITPEQLRSLAQTGTWHECATACFKAAAELDRLSAALAEAQKRGERTGLERAKEIYFQRHSQFNNRSFADDWYELGAKIDAEISRLSLKEPPA